ncbi:septum formation initiator [Paractinoplanes abujensis]|uniref:Secretion/DNA translocation related CpaE-like protein n=1 Tax=Paractinoplanes abujensis TaxID=882441 RepID=A0A7W7CW74_9ACTN|nr:septum site-determining protein Ssd [Actinoplanes abujensis]MBB4695791.1 secretion/DNA translocation related CpaE-like protein [Actinoplanes abujensis]GID23377.1 septum formation initiator [Actinoplanes abujensis]
MPVARLPLVVTSDPDLLDDLLRLAAAGGTEIDVAPDPAAARPRYGTAPLVLIGADQLDACLRARLPRRSRVAVVGRGEVAETMWKAANAHGVEHIAELPVADAWVVDRFAEQLDQPVGRVLAVIGGRGGAGASTLAAGLATTATAARHRTLLIDADPLGGGLDLMFGWERRDGLRWSALAEAGGRVDPPTLLEALPHQGDLVVLSFDRDTTPLVPAEAMGATIDAGRRARDVIVVDLPRRLDDAGVLALECADQAVLIVPAEVRASAAAARIARTVQAHRRELSLVVRGPAPGKLKPREISAALGLPLIGTLRPEPAISQGAERGLPPAVEGKGPLADLCRRLLGDLLAGSAAVAA